MANDKPIGVAYADPAFDSIVVSGAASVGGALTGATATFSGAVSGTAFTSTGNAAASNAVAGLYFYTTAITANSTLTSTPIGSLATTSNATGLGKLFTSDGTKWQFAAVA